MEYSNGEGKENFTPSMDESPSGTIAQVHDLLHIAHILIYPHIPVALSRATPWLLYESCVLATNQTVERVSSLPVPPIFLIYL